MPTLGYFFTPPFCPAAAPHQSVASVARTNINQIFHLLVWFILVVLIAIILCQTGIRSSVGLRNRIQSPGTLPTASFLGTYSKGTAHYSIDDPRPFHIQPSISPLRKQLYLTFMPDRGDYRQSVHRTGIVRQAGSLPNDV